MAFLVEQGCPLPPTLCFVASEGAHVRERAQKAEGRTPHCPLKEPCPPCGGCSHLLCVKGRELCLCRESLCEPGLRAAECSCASRGDSGSQSQGQGQPHVGTPHAPGAVPGAA